MIGVIAGVVLGFQAFPKPMPPIQMLDATGISRTVPAKSPATVLVFVGRECPIANRMAPELGRIVSTYKTKSVSFFFVYADPGQTNRQIAQHIKDFKLGAPGIYDSQHRLVKAVGATVTPQAAILSPQGKLLYRGRINDLFLEHGRVRKTPKNEDLKRALDEILAGKPISVKETPALGCSIPPLG